MTPTSAPANQTDFILTVNGRNFVNSTAVLWNGLPLKTTYVSATQVNGTAPAALISSPGSASVMVSNPAPGGGVSPTKILTINPGSRPKPNPYPAPDIAALSPNVANAKGSAFTLRVNGHNFINSSSVMWNGSPLQTTLVSATQLNGAVPAALIASPGPVAVTVSNPLPGSGTSTTLFFRILALAPPPGPGPGPGPAPGPGPGPGPGSAPHLMQFNTYQTSGNNGENDSTLQFKGATKKGNAIWVAVTLSDYAGAHSISVSDTQHNAYTLLNQQNDPRPGSQTVAHFYAANIVGDQASPDIVTLHWGNENYKGILITEIAGVTASPLVGNSANIQDGLNAGNNNVTSGAISVASARVPALLVALSMNTTGGSSDLGGSGVGGPATGSGFAQQAVLWDWGTNLATFESMAITGAGNASVLFSALHQDSYVTVAAIFH